MRATDRSGTKVRRAVRPIRFCDTAVVKLIPIKEQFRRPLYKVLEATVCRCSRLRHW
jgi:hypothetical protein